MPYDWYSKKQSTVETATYGSEFVAARIATDQIIDHRLMLRYLGVPIRKKTYMFGNNKSVVDSSSLPHSKLHKRHTALSFHRVHEALAAGIILFTHIGSTINPADILSKHWSHANVWPMLQDLLFWEGHVAFVYNNTHILHANAHSMSVSIEPLANAQSRISRLGGGEILAHKRLKG